MSKFFHFSSREVRVQFFDGPGAVVVSLTISDETDIAFVRAAELIKQGTETGDVQQRLSVWTEAVDALIGEDARKQILAQAPHQDCFAVAEIYRFVVDAYGAAKVKNLSASAR